MSTTLHDKIQEHAMKFANAIVNVARNASIADIASAQTETAAAALAADGHKALLAYERTIKRKSRPSR